MGLGWHLAGVAGVAFGGASAVLAAIASLASGAAPWPPAVLAFAVVAPLATVLWQVRSDVRVAARRASRSSPRVKREIERSRRELTGALQLMRYSEPYPIGPGTRWSIGWDGLAVIVQELARARATRVLELGSGLSTLVIARWLRDSANGRIVSIDHDDAFATRTRAHLSAMGLDAVASVFHAPLRPIVVDGYSHDWYDLPAMIQDERFDVLVVDGPPNLASGDGRQRYPALPVLQEALSADAVVIVDDYVRKGERWMVDEWLRRHDGWKLHSGVDVAGLAILTRTNGR